MKKTSLPSNEAYQSGSMPEIFSLIEVLSKKLSQMQRDTVRESGLTPPQFATLSLLWEDDGLPLKDLAEGVFCTPATMTGLVDTLEKKGLVRRVPHPNDRRSILIKLTETGAELRNIVPQMEKIFSNCCEMLSPEEARELSRLLKKMNDSL